MRLKHNLLLPFLLLLTLITGTLSMQASLSLSNPVELESFKFVFGLSQSKWRYLHDTKIPNNRNLFLSLVTFTSIGKSFLSSICFCLEPQDNRTFLKSSSLFFLVLPPTQPNHTCAGSKDLVHILNYLMHASLSPLFWEATEAKSIPRMMATFNMFSETHMLFKKSLSSRFWHKTVNLEVPIFPVAAS